MCDIFHLLEASPEICHLVNAMNQIKDDIATLYIEHTYLLTENIRINMENNPFEHSKTCQFIDNSYRIYLVISHIHEKTHLYADYSVIFADKLKYSTYYANAIWSAINARQLAEEVNTMYIENEQMKEQIDLLESSL